MWVYTLHKEEEDDDDDNNNNNNNNILNTNIHRSDNQFNPLAHEFDVVNACKLAETFS